MLNKIKSFFKGKDYTVIERYSEGGFEIRVKEDEDANQLISLRDTLENQLIEVSKSEDSIKHVIYDSLKGIKIEVDIPISTYKRLMADK